MSGDCFAYDLELNGTISGSGMGGLAIEQPGGPGARCPHLPLAKGFPRGDLAVSFKALRTTCHTIC